MTRDEVVEVLSPSPIDTGANLKVKDVRGLDLPGVNSSGATLFCTHMNSAELSSANLTEAKLTSARFFGITGKETIKGLYTAVDRHRAKFDWIGISERARFNLHHVDPIFHRLML